MASRPISSEVSLAARQPSTSRPTRCCPLTVSPGSSPICTRQSVTVSDRARRVRLLCVDVDGVLTDAGMYYGPDGEVLKKFNTRDGMGLARVRAAGVAVAIISGEDSAIVHARAAKLQIDDVFSGVANKLEVMKDLAARQHVETVEVAYIGDDLNDLAAMEYVGLA